MVQDAKARRGAKRGNKCWLGLLILPWIAMIWVPSYNKIDPQLWGFPFFYWYQLLWVGLSAVITLFVYIKTRASWKSDSAQGDRQ